MVVVEDGSVLFPNLAGVNCMWFGSGKEFRAMLEVLLWALPYVLTCW